MYKVMSKNVYDTILFTSFARQEYKRIFDKYVFFDVTLNTLNKLEKELSIYSNEDYQNIVEELERALFYKKLVGLRIKEESYMEDLLSKENPSYEYEDYESREENYL